MIQVIAIVRDAWDRALFEAYQQNFRSRDINCIAFGYNSQDALSLYQEKKPDLLIMPFVMPGSCALTVARRLKKQYPRARLLIIMQQPLRLFARLIFDEMLGGLISRHASIEQVIEAIHQSQTNTRYFFQEYAHYFVDEVARYSPSDVFKKLTNREWDVMVGLTQYKSIRQIAKELSVTPETIYSHCHHLFEKLKIDDEQGFFHLIRKQQLMF